MAEEVEPLSSDWMFHQLKAWTPQSASQSILQQDAELLITPGVWMYVQLSTAPNKQVAPFMVVLATSVRDKYCHIHSCEK